MNHSPEKLNNLEVHSLLDRLFRDHYTKTVAVLTRCFGTARLELVEEAVQESLLRAVKTWPHTGIPSHPEAWLYRTAKNLAIDALRREQNLQRKKKHILSEGISIIFPEPEYLDSNHIKDDQLKMLFICCHPVLSRESQLCLGLKTLCGLSVSEIARALLSNEPTIAQRIVRAKRKIKEEKLPFELPHPSQLPDRLDSVLRVLYLLFNEGYSAYEGDLLLREDLCFEAIRLVSLLLSSPAGNFPQVHALQALFLLQASRLPGRLNAEGHILLLANQDRNIWDQVLIRRGIYQLQLAKEGNELSTYHLLAGIAACHCLAKSYEDTDWPTILWYYEELVKISPSPIHAMNRAIALSQVAGTPAGLEALLNLSNGPFLKSHYLYYASLAEFYKELKNYQEASDHCLEALALVKTAPEKELLIRKLKELQEKSS